MSNTLPEDQPGSVSPRPVEVLTTTWTFKSPYGQPDRPLIMGGDRIVGLYNKRKIYAVNLYTGTEITSESVPGSGFPYQCQSDNDPLPAAAAGAVFLMEGTTLRALELSDGSARDGWTNPQISGVVGLAAFDDVVLVVISSWGNTQVAAYSTVDGSVAWAKGPFTVSGSSSGAISPGRDAIFFAAQNQLFAVNTDFGDVRFPQPASGAAPAVTYTLDQTQAPLVGNKVVICCGDNVYGFDIKKGTLAWSLAPQVATQWTATMSEDKSFVVAVNTQGQVYVLNTDDGSLICQAQLDEGGIPSVAGNTVYVITPDHTQMHALEINLFRKTLTEAGLYSLGQGICPVGPIIGNGTVFIPTTDGNLSAKPFTSFQAAFFNGQTRVDVQPDSTEFQFGTGDFTVEAWVRSSEGGEIASGYPATTDPDSHGFRFNLSSLGELRFAAVNTDGSNQDLAKSVPTPAADGFWHHVAVVRQQGQVAMYVDGVTAPVATLQIRNGMTVYRNGQALDANGQPVLNQLVPPPPPMACNVNGQKGLTLGAYVGGQQAPANSSFAGLLREVRMWDVAVQAATLQSRMNQILPPTVAHLKGNWHLDSNEGQGVNVVNDVVGHEYPAVFNNGSSVNTDLNLEDSAFPYLLDQAQLQWPYSGHWAARGEYAIQTPAAISADGVICFGTNNELYGVNKSDGSRKWSLPIAIGCSTPVAQGCAFYVMTQQFGLIEIDAQSGQFAEVDGFQGLQPPAVAPGANPPTLSAPAADGRYLAAALPDGRLWIKDFANASTPPVSFTVGQNPGDLFLDSGKLYCVAEPGGAQKQLYTILPSGGNPATVAVDSGVFCAWQNWLFSIQNNQLTVLDTSKTANNQWTATAVTGNQITGLAADPDANLLVVATNQGKLFGLSFATLGLSWSTVIPDGTASTANAARGVLNVPAIDGRDVYCTSRSGAVAAVDGRTGQLRGLFFEQTAVVTPPLISAGTAYFGCDDNAPNASLDGALHSVVFGQTYALRLGVTPLDQADSNNGYAVVEQTDPANAISLRNVGQCCVEAWYNSSNGGELLSLCPSTASNLGLRLWLDKTGVIHFTLIDKPVGQNDWQTLTAQANAAGLLDGRWHHVAVSCQDAATIRIYFDGVSHDVTLTPAAPVTPAATVASLLAYIGADATQTNNVPANTFQGLIGEVRLWDTYLVASEISDRMHDKLRGDEPDLVAYWNFDTVGVHDASRNGYDGALAPANGDATFWLTDLSFEHPNYPFFTTAASITQVGDPSSSDPTLRDTIYALSVVVHKADGTPLSGQNVEFWYVKHGDLQEPDTISVQSSKGMTTLTGIAPAQPETPSTDSFKGVTDASGLVKLKVITSDLDHGPSFDVRADFMPDNERYHVNVLLNNQRLAKPAPPTLVAQSKLIQDYHWSTGGQINSDRSRETYRTVISAFNPDHTPRANERVELYADDTLDIEVSGTVHTISAGNSQAFYTDAEGELTVVVSATDLQTPHLSVWAGFMNAQARYVIDPSQDAHDTLANVQGSDMADTNRTTNWKPDSEGGPDKGALLNSDYQPHANEVAGAVRHVMSASQNTRGQTSSGGGRQGLRAGLRASPTFGDMAQPVGIPRADIIRALPTLRHIQRKAPITPEAFKASLQQFAPAGTTGFTLTGDGTAAGFSVQYHSGPSPLELKLKGAAVQTMPVHSQRLGWFGSDLWNAVKHDVENVYEKAKSIVVSIVNDALHVVAELADGIYSILPNSIKHLVDIVVGFLKKLALELIQIIKFLMMLFDWKAILAAHTILKQTLLNCADRAVDAFSDGEAVTRAFAPLLQVLGIPSGSITGNSDDVAPAGQGQVPSASNSAVAGSNSVSAKMIHSKVKENSAGMAIATAQTGSTARPPRSGTWTCLRTSSSESATSFPNLPR